MHNTNSSRQLITPSKPRCKDLVRCRWLPHSHTSWKLLTRTSRALSGSLALQSWCSGSATSYGTLRAPSTTQAILTGIIRVPISTAFGRRGVYIFSQLICFGSSIWRAKAQTYASFMGASVLNGIAAGPAETIQPAVIADIFFLHDRGFWNTLYWCFYMGSLMVAPIISGSMALHIGWRSFWWLNTGLLGLSVVLAVVAFPETKWHRMHPDEVIKQAAAEAKASPPLSTEGKEVADTEKSGGVAQPITTEESVLSHQATAERDPWLGRGSPSKQQWKIFQPNKAPFMTILMDLWIPWKLFAFPIVEFSAFVVSWSCSSFLTINLTQSQNFAAPPYSYNSEVIGFFNFAILIGAAIGLATAGKSIESRGRFVSQGRTKPGTKQCCLT